VHVQRDIELERGVDIKIRSKQFVCGAQNTDALFEVVAINKKERFTVSMEYIGNSTLWILVYRAGRHLVRGDA